MKDFFEKNHAFFFIFLIGLYGLIYHYLDFRLPVRFGLGWDGMAYAAYAENFTTELTTTSDSYHVARCFPSLLIWLFYKLIRTPLMYPKQIFSAFYIFNTLCFMLIGLFWGQLAKFKKFSFQTSLFGFICLFCNYSFFVFYKYISVITDVFGLLLGIAVLYCYLKKSKFCLSLLLIPAMFSWPIGVVFILILLLFIDSKPEVIASRPNNKGAMLLAATFFLLLYCGNQNKEILSMFRAQGTGFATDYILLSSFLASIYVFLLARYLPFSLLLNCFKQIALKHFLMVLGLLLGVLLFYRYVMSLSPNYNPEHSATSLSIISQFIFYQIPFSTLIKPGLFFVMQVVNWGPAAFLLLLFSHQIFKKAGQEGIGFLILFCISLYFSLNPQYRFNIFLIPTTLFVLCLVIEDLKIKGKFCFYYFLLALFCSKIYYPVFLSSIENLNPTIEELYTTGLQKVFMNTGYWVSWDGYWVTLSITLTTGFILGFILIRSKLYLPFMVADNYRRASAPLIHYY